MFILYFGLAITRMDGQLDHSVYQPLENRTDGCSTKICFAFAAHGCVSSRLYNQVQNVKFYHIKNAFFSKSLPYCNNYAYKLLG